MTTANRYTFGIDENRQFINFFFFRGSNEDDSFTRAYVILFMS